MKTSEALSAEAFAAALATRLGSKAPYACDGIGGWAIEGKLDGVYGRVYWFLRFNDNAEHGGIDFRYEADEVEVFGAITKTTKGFVWEVDAIRANNCHPSTFAVVASFVEKVSLASRDC